MEVRENSDEESVQIQRRVQGVSYTGADMPGTSEVRHNVSADDYDNITTWVILGADSYSFGIGRSRTLVVEEPTSMIYKGTVRRDEGTYSQVKSFVNEHSCPLEEIYRRHRQASAVIIRELVAPRLQQNDSRLMRPKDIIVDMKTMYGIQIMYRKIRGYNVCYNCIIRKRKGGALGYIDDLVFIFDQHASIEAGISKVFPYATHIICCWHFAENVKKRFHRKDVAAIMDKAARAYTELKYNRYMDELRNLHKNAFNYVEAASPHRWSRVHCPQRRYRVMTTNVTECINSCLKFARQLPMLTLAEFIRNML
ncbi:hypothetical protein Dsin_023756 [Dipteronia sinensis]|uniref:MULE transposase domain-containing protein n=1 Tax=Dipteronia sinensis TaxID=43782 RepID=A0AAE0A5D5_9ROSI|nr:hypothetical protein Dsin_023756 [Dipteronia sinensis]